MKRWLIALTVSLGLLAPAAAFWQSRDSNYNVAISAGATYQGPGDIVSGWKEFLSCGRAYNASFASTQGAICLLYGNTTATTCTLSVGTNGFANLTATPCVGGTVTVVTFCTVTNTSCNIQEKYDQTGNGNHAIQATPSAMPGITFAAKNGLPCTSANTTGTAIGMPTTTNITQLPPISYEAVVERTGNTTTVQRIISGITGSTSNLLGFRGAVNSVAFNTGGTQLQSSSGTPDNSFLALIGNGDSNANADSIIIANGSSVAGPAATGIGSTSGEYSFDGWIGNAAPVTGFECEVGIIPAFLNSTQYGNLTTNMRSATNGWNF